MGRWVKGGQSGEAGGGDSRSPGHFTRGQSQGRSHRGQEPSQRGQEHVRVMGSVNSVLVPRALGDKAFFMKRGRNAGEPAQRRLENRRSVSGARRFRGGRDRWGPWPPDRAVAFRWREAPSLFTDSGLSLSGAFAGTRRGRDPSPRGGPALLEANGPNIQTLSSDCTETHGSEGRRVGAPAVLSGLHR